jgi:hypothetical protein
MIIEGVGGGNYGAFFETCATNTIRGTAEACISGGLRLDIDCLRNLIDEFDAESNGTEYDYLIDGSFNKMVGCVGANTNKGSKITGGSNILETMALRSWVTTTSWAAASSASRRRLR